MDEEITDKDFSHFKKHIFKNGVYLVKYLMQGLSNTKWKHYNTGIIRPSVKSVYCTGYLLEEKTAKRNRD